MSVLLRRNRKPPVWLALLLAALLLTSSWPFMVHVRAAAAFVQECTASGNDATCTFASAPSASNIVLVASTTGTETETISITGWTPSVSTLIGPIDSAAFTLRGYTFCTIGDGADTTMVLTTSAANQARTAAVEVSGIGTDCATALDDAEGADCTGDGATPELQTLATALTTTAAGDFIFGFSAGTNNSNYSAGSGYTSVPAGNGDIGSEAQGAWKVAGGSGSEAITWTTAAVEDTLCLGVALKAAAAAAGAPGDMLLLGVGR